jgi:putative transposase
VRYAWIEDNRAEFDIARMCRVLAVSRSGYYGWRTRIPSDRAQSNKQLDAKVASIHTQHHARYGRPRIVRELRSQGLRVGSERVRSSLNRQGLRTIYRRPYRNTTDSNHGKPVAPNLLDRQFAPGVPDQAWVCDITYIATAEGWLYLACVLDIGTRRIVGWSMSARMKAQLVCDALAMAYLTRGPKAGLIVHSDRGVQYASEQYRTLLTNYKMVQSMSRRANCRRIWELSAAMESTFKSLKVECVYRTRYETRDQARAEVFEWIEAYYNRVRLHSSLNYLSPEQYEQQLKR